MTTCKNCSTTFEGKFCPGCSQKADTARFTLLHLGHDLNHALTHTDKGIFFLLKELCYRPGIVAREFIEGKRKKYFNPLTYLLIMITINIVVLQQTHFYDVYNDQMESFATTVAQMSGDKQQIEKVSKDMEAARLQTKLASDNSKIITLAMVPVLALLTWIFFRKQKINYAENLVFNIFLMAQLLVFFQLACILPFLVKPSLAWLYVFLYMVGSWAYCFFAYKQFFGERWRWVIPKGIAVQVLYIIVVAQASKLWMSLFA